MLGALSLSEKDEMVLRVMKIGIHYKPEAILLAVFKGNFEHPKYKCLQGHLHTMFHRGLLNRAGKNRYEVEYWRSR